MPEDEAPAAVAVVGAEAMAGAALDDDKLRRALVGGAAPRPPRRSSSRSPGRPAASSSAPGGCRPATPTTGCSPASPSSARRRRPWGSGSPATVTVTPARTVASGTWSSGPPSCRWSSSPEWAASPCSSS
ncbi:hypothetical protein ACP4OV_031303 [Aristida adscensionis]